MCVAYNVHILRMLNILTDPPINFAIDHMVNADVFSGINNVTVYISLLRRDPLLLARINGFRILLFYVGQSLPPENEEVNIVENKVISSCIDD